MIIHQEADFGVTLNTYTHLKIDDAREELLKLAQKQEDADKEIQKLGMRKEKFLKGKKKW